MNLQLTRIYALLIAGLAVSGLFVNGHLFDLMNVDPALDAIRVVLAAYLLYIGFVSKTRDLVTGGLFATGMLYIGMGVAGLISPTLAGLLPSGLTGFDIAFHLAAGGLALFASMHKSSTSAAHA